MTYTNTWLEMQFKSYFFYRNNGYFDLARHTKQIILGTTKMTEQEFEERLKG